MLMKLMTLIKSNIATEALWYADNAYETDHADEADDADEADEAEPKVKKLSVRLSIKLFGEACDEAAWWGCP